MEVILVLLVSAGLLVVLKDRHTVQAHLISLCHPHHSLRACQDQPKTVVAAFVEVAVMADGRCSQVAAEQARTLTQVDHFAVQQAQAA